MTMKTPKDKDKDKPPGRPLEDMGKVQAVIEQLSQLCDLIGLREQIIHKSKLGKKPHPTDPWGYTREILAYYAEATDPQQVIGLFESVGCHNDIDALRFILRHDEIVP